MLANCKRYLGITWWVLPTSVIAGEYQQLPGPVAMPPQNVEYQLYLTLEVNGNVSSETTPVLFRKDHYWVSAATLRAHHIQILTQATEDLIDTSTLPQVEVEYQSARQVLSLRVPNNWLPAQSLTNTGNMERTKAQSSVGFLFSYDSYTNRSTAKNVSTNTQLELRSFGDKGTLNLTGVSRQPWHSTGQQLTKLIRYDTNWKYSDTDRIVSYQFGDVISNSLTWSNSVRFGGLRISRNFSIRPDVITYPMFNWSGTANLPSSVDLFINGYKSSSHAVNAGPYTLTNVPYVTGAGEATVVTTDSLGRQISTSVPFYVSNTLLRQGLSDFDFSLGALRNNYGLNSFGYSQGAVSGIYRYGLCNTVTGSLHGEAEAGLVLAGVGGDMRIGRWGTLSFSSSQSQTDKSGTQYSLGYSYTGQHWSFNAQHLQRSDQYIDLSSYRNDSQPSHRSEQATLTLIPYQGELGTWGLGYFDVLARDRSQTRLVNLSWSRTLGYSSNLSISVNKALGDNNFTGQLQLAISFSGNDTLSWNSQRVSNNNYSHQVTWSHSAPPEGGVGWDITHNLGAKGYNQASLTWLNQYNSFSGGYYGNNEQNNQWVELSGSLVYMDQDWFATRKVNDAFIVVNTYGFEGIPISYENRLVGKTNRQGHLLIPWVSAWYPGKITIDPMNLPINSSIANVEQRVTVAEGSGALINFPIQKVRSATIKVLDLQHQPLLLGTPVLDTITKQNSMVGYDGLVWLTNLDREVNLKISHNGESCQAKYQLPNVTPIPVDLGVMICDRQSSNENEK